MMISRGAASAKAFGFTNSKSCSGPAHSSQSYVTPGTYTWKAPTGVTKVSIVAVGAGGGGGSAVDSGGGGGGGLGYLNNYSVTPGNCYTVVVGSGGVSGSGTTAGGCSYFLTSATVKGGGGGKGLTSSRAAGGTCRMARRAGR